MLGSVKIINKLRNQAVRLRLLGKSYKEIDQEIHVAKSTLSYWLKDVELTPQQQLRLYTKQVNILSRGPKSQRDRRAKLVDQIVSSAKREVALPISDESIKLFGVGLYWAEGSKSKLLQITNSDPYLILFMVRWLHKVFGVPPTSLRIHLNLYSQQREQDIKLFWSELTGIPLENFGKSYIKPENKGFKKNNLYYGTARIYVPKSTDYKYQMLGWLSALLESYKTDVESVKQRWTRLKDTKRPTNLRVPLPR